MKQLLTKETLLNFILTIGCSLITAWIKRNAAGMTPTIYVLLYFSCVIFFMIEKLKVRYGPEFEMVGAKQFKWCLTTLVVKGLYFFAGISFLSGIISLYLAICKAVLFYGVEDKTMTWEEIKQVIRLIVNKLKLN